MDKTVYQAKKKAIKKPISTPKLKLKKRLKPIELAQKIGEYLDTLEPVLFTLLPDDEKDPMALPIQTAEILYKESILNREGQFNWNNQAKLRNSSFVKQVENKILYAIIANHIDNQIYISLRKALTKPELQGNMLEDDWGIIATLLAEYYTPLITNLFISERYPDRLTNAKTLQRLPLEKCNKQVNDLITKNINQDSEKIKDTIYMLLRNSIFFKKIRSKKEIIEKATSIVVDFIPAASYFSYDLDIKLNVTNRGRIKIETIYNF